MDFYHHAGHEFENYEKSHGSRLQYLINDLKLDEIRNKRIIEFGYGLGHLYNKFSRAFKNNNHYVGVDYVENPTIKPTRYFQHDLNTEFLLKDTFDYGFCFETCEHLTAPYTCLLNLKERVVEDGIIYLSVPGESCQHNVLYPALFYPVNNFIDFLTQMGLEIIEHKKHNICFSQEVFTLKNLGWDKFKMKWFKGEPKFQNQPPHIQINL